MVAQAQSEVATIQSNTQGSPNHGAQTSVQSLTEQQYKQLLSLLNNNVALENSTVAAAFVCCA
ncbi:hypothetical protein Ancab_007927, partial [Ancistrocladus abbreviatus]